VRRDHCEHGRFGEHWRLPPPHRVPLRRSHLHHGPGYLGQRIRLGYQ